MGITVNPAVLEWAIERSGKQRDAIEDSKINLTGWLNQTVKPTLKDLEKFAKKTHVPVGYLCGGGIPDEPLPIKDFRLISGKSQATPKGNVLDLIYECQMRQSWYSSYCEEEGLGKVDLVGSYNTNQNPADVAKEIAKSFSFTPKIKALERYVELIEEQGILVMASSIVKGNTSRPIHIEDLRGFALVDEYAPVIFVNTKDTKNARKFTLIHELGHILVGSAGISNASASDKIDNKVESWCNKFATEILLPEDKLRAVYEENYNSEEPFANLEDLGKKFGVSTLMLMLRIYDLKYYKQGAGRFWQEFKEEKKRVLKIIADQEALQKQEKPKGGGNYYNTVPSRMSKKLCIAVLISTMESNTSYKDAFNLMNISSTKTFKILARDMGV